MIGAEQQCYGDFGREQTTKVPAMVMRRSDTDMSKRVLGSEFEDQAEVRRMEKVSQSFFTFAQIT